MLTSVAAAAFASKSGHTHDMGFVNPILGTHGFPDCVPGPQGVSSDDLDANQMNMVCNQRVTAPTALKIACVGDSITAGAHSSGPTKTYPAQLQGMLNASQYSVTNLGACGSTMQKNADSPYWKRPQYAALTAGRWDMVVIMLGTNDAKDKADGGPPNWLDNCGALPNLDLSNCTFAQDYISMITLIRTLGTTPGVSPVIYLAIPAPLMEHGSIGANQTVINSVYPALVPLIAAAANITTVPISIYASMGGVPNWQESFPSRGCSISSPWPACPWWCDAQSCDQCHPNDK